MFEYTDETPMPFGKYGGLPMRDIPAAYLFWLWTHKKDPMSKKVKVDPVAAYIQKNLDNLKLEHPDGIWE
jgi:uncharacterized protein (DUF3820 family)